MGFRSMGVKEIFRFFFFCSLFLFLFLPGFSSTKSLQYEKRKVGTVWVHLIRADLSSARIKVGVHIPPPEKFAHGKFPHQPFSSMIRETNPAVAIDGTYYDTKTFQPVGTLVEKGEFLVRGKHGIAVCFDEQNHVVFQPVSNFREFPWKKFQVVLSTGPTLIRDGHIHLYPYAEKFHDPDLFRPARRSALGVTQDGELLLVATRAKIWFRDMAWIMKKLGAVQAVSLDGGSSTALYYRGKYLIHPARVLTNIFCIYEQKQVAQEKEANSPKD